jgi:hypothetical protein
MNPDGPGIGKLFIFAVAGEAEVVVVIGLGQLRPAGSPMRIMTVKTEDPCIKMTAFLNVEPLLMMGFRMGLRISPDSGLELIVIRQGFPYFIRLVVFVIPWKFKGPDRNADPSRMALAANLQTPFVR